MLRAVNKWAVLRKLFEDGMSGEDLIYLPPEEVFKIFTEEAAELLTLEDLSAFGIPKHPDNKEIIRSAKEDAQNLLDNKPELLALIQQSLKEIHKNIDRAVNYHSRHTQN